ncbi:helix-turn-helix transcriptional regulator [Megamonas funiformis]|uniref:helix-turn-helix transcriptional regulator n=1 Tax=Megamonas funiformis TaxID=437897 RepID=UPI002674F1DB|nr:helix-turn-helix transcriptional regulator [Megamonas funiformis]
MNKEFAKMCYFARLKTGLSVKNASELLNICERQLNYYESGQKNIPDDIVAKMTKIYVNPELGYEYLRQTQTGQELALPAINMNGISSRTLQLRVSIRKVIDVLNKLDIIACDDVIEQKELDIFVDCMKQIQLLSGACVGIRLFQPIKKIRTAENSTDLINNTLINF